MVDEEAIRFDFAHQELVLHGGPTLEEVQLVSVETGHFKRKPSSLFPDEVLDYFVNPLLKMYPAVGYRSIALLFFEKYSFKIAERRIRLSMLRLRSEDVALRRAMLGRALRRHPYVSAGPMDCW